MITREADYETSMTTAQTPLSLETMNLSEKMSSEEWNYNNATIYQAINTLYERIRLLEDIKDYIRTYTLKQIADKKAAFEQTLQEIQQNQDIYTDDKKQAVLAPFSWSDDPVQDRDGTTVSPLDHTETSIFPRGNTASSAAVSLIKHDCMNTPFTIKTSETDRYYEAVYLLPKPGVVYDTVTFMFSRAKEINYVDCDLYNVTVQASYLTESNTPAPILLNQYVPPVKAYGLVFDVVCKDYTTVDQNVDKTKLAADAFSSFSDTSSPMGQTESQTAAALQANQYKEAVRQYKAVLS